MVVHHSQTRETECAAAEMATGSVTQSWPCSPRGKAHCTGYGLNPKARGSGTNGSQSGTCAPHRGDGSPLACELSEMTGGRRHRRVPHAAVGAALWAVDEAISRDIPLRLLYAIDQTARADTDPQDAAHQLATAEQAVRHASTAVESTGKPVKIEVEILRSRPTRALMDASRSAALVCIGVIGLNHFAEGRVGSTAASLAAVAQCPVAIIRWRDTCRVPTPGWIVVEVDESRDPTALQLGLDEARLRGAPVRVLATWQSRFTDIHDARAVTDGNRAARAQLDRRLAYGGDAIRIST